ncbi:hypothetical protein ABWH92_05630 [Ahrensia marina]|uniref:hypothetical protein n=1 Tax=Ahrensia marina TaxID=1514904 RepID=UPI0035D04AFD
MPSRLPHAALGTLIILQLVMLASLFAGVAPHPPRAIPLFAMAPFLAASMAIATMALVLGPLSSKAARALTGLAVITALISYGPQKWIDAAIGEIWPAVLLGQIASLILLTLVAKPSLAESEHGRAFS